MIVATGVHLFSEGDTVMHLDGRVGVVRRADVLRAYVRTEGAFPERLTIEQGDPAWWNDGPAW